MSNFAIAAWTNPRVAKSAKNSAVPVPVDLMANGEGVILSPVISNGQQTVGKNVRTHVGHMASKYDPFTAFLQI